MEIFLLSVAVLASIGFGFTLLGRAILAAAGTVWLRRPSFENLSVAAFLGTGAWVLAFGTLSHLGIRTRPIVWLLLGLSSVFIAYHWRRRRDWFQLRRPRLAGWVAGAAVATTAYLALAPTRKGDCINPFNDSMTYVILSRWLQEHPYSEPCSDLAIHPHHFWVCQYQEGGFRMGAVFLLASIEALTPAPYNGLDVLAGLSVWGVMLAASGIFLVARWCLKTPRLIAAIGLVVTSVTSNPFYFASSSGFIPQLYGLAGLSLSTALLSRLGRPYRWNTANAVPLGLAFASLVSVYSEFAPFLAALALSFLAAHGIRAARIGRLKTLAAFAFWVVLWTLAVGNYEHLRACRALLIQSQVVVGWNIPWSAGDWLSGALGVHSFFVAPPMFAWTVAALLAGLGLVAARNTAGSLPVLTILGVFGAMAAAFLFIRDPWTGTRGHTWSLFKICQWWFPFLAALQAAGLAWFWKRRALGISVTAAVGVAASICFIPIHKETRRRITEPVRHLAASPHPHRVWREIGAHLERLEAESIYIVAEDGELFPAVLTPYLVYPRPVLSAPWDSVRQKERPSLPSNTVCLSWGRNPFDKDLPFLPGGLSVLPTDRPVLWKVRDPTTLQAAADGPVLRIGEKGARVVLWSPIDCTAELSFDAGPLSAASGRLELALALPTGRTVRKAAAGGTAWSEVFPVKAGFSEIEFRRSIPVSNDRIAKSAAEPGVELSRLHLRLAGGPETMAAGAEREATR